MPTMKVPSTPHEDASTRGGELDVAEKSIVLVRDFGGRRTRSLLVETRCGHTIANRPAALAAPAAPSPSGKPRALTTVVTSSAGCSAAAAAVHHLRRDARTGIASRLAMHRRSRIARQGPPQ